MKTLFQIDFRPYYVKVNGVTRQYDSRHYDSRHLDNTEVFTPTLLWSTDNFLQEELLLHHITYDHFVVSGRF